jgi:hypothetical protein
MRQHISRSFEHAGRLRHLNHRLREFARQTVGEVPSQPTGSDDAYPTGIPMNEELRLAIEAAEQPLADLNEVIGWLEQMFGTEVAAQSPATKPTGIR